MDADPEIIVSLVVANLLLVPNFVEIRTKKPTKFDNIEYDGCVEQKYDQAKNEFLSPRKPNIGALHPAYVAEHKRGYPESQCPDDCNPNATTLGDRLSSNGLWVGQLGV